MAGWKKTGIGFAALLTGPLLAAGYVPSFAADGPVMPPLSHYGSLLSPALHLEDLKPAARKAVETAIADAGQGSRKAGDAERVVRAAKHADGKARAGSAGVGTLDISFGGGRCRYSGEIADHQAAGVGMMICASRVFEGQFHADRPDGLGADYRIGEADAYEGEYKDGERTGFGIERDRDGFYPGRYGFYIDPHDRQHRVNMELSGLQNFRGTHWAGTYGAYAGPKIACTLIKGAFLEGSVLDGFGAKFDADGQVTEQGLYAVGIRKDGGGPPC